MQDRTCSVETCDLPCFHKQEWCRSHYRRVSEGGSLKPEIPLKKYIRGTEEERFWLHVDKNGPIARAGLSNCWLWTGFKEESGYGRMARSKGRKRSPHWVHRFALELVHGPLGDLDSCHRCDVPACVRNDEQGHLFPGTPDDNTKDMITKGRMAVGPQRWNTKLTENQVRHIRSRDTPINELAARYGVTRGTIKSVLNGQTWKHVD